MEITIDLERASRSDLAFICNIAEGCARRGSAAIAEVAIEQLGDRALCELVALIGRAGEESEGAEIADHMIGRRVAETIAFIAACS